MNHMALRPIARTVFFLFLFLFASRAQAAGLTISEIMFDPAGSDDKREWVEIYNGGSVPLDLSGHSILTDGASSSKHALVAQNGSVLGSEAYAVIVQDVAGFTGGFPSYAGQIFDSSWNGLTASVGKTILLIDPESAVLDSVTYDPSIGGANTGESLQQNASGAWVAAVPTPGSAPNGQSTTGVDDGEESSDDDSTNLPNPTLSVGGIQAGSSQDTKAVAALSNPRAELILPARAISGIPVKISVRAYESGDALRILGVSHVALGDGSAYTGKALDTFTHVYAHPGTYAVTFEYRGNPYSLDPDLTTRETIQVSEPGVSIASVVSNGTIELSNDGGRDADISGWILAPLGEAFAADRFIFPSGTVVLVGKKILLSPKVTGLSPARAQVAELLLPSGERATPLVTAVVSPENFLDTSEILAPEVLVQDAHVSAPLAESVSAVSQANASTALKRAENPRAPTVERTLPIFPFTLGVVAVLVVAGMRLWKVGMTKKSTPATVGQATLPDKEDIRILE